KASSTTPIPPTPAGSTTFGACISGSIARRSAATSRASGGAAMTNTASTELARGASPAPRAADALALAAAPTFAAMALLNVVRGSAQDAICSATYGSGLSGMVPLRKFRADAAEFIHQRLHLVHGAGARRLRAEGCDHKARDTRPMPLCGANPGIAKHQAQD